MYIGGKPQTRFNRRSPVPLLRNSNQIKGIWITQIFDKGCSFLASNMSELLFVLLFENLQPFPIYPLDGFNQEKSGNLTKFQDIDLTYRR